MIRFDFALALIVAALFSNPFTADPYRRAWRAVKALFGYPRGAAQVDIQVYVKRMTCCEKCPLYFKPLRTCGSPFRMTPDQGCWCFMPVKALLQESACWADESFDRPAHSWSKCLENEQRREFEREQAIRSITNGDCHCQ